MTHEYGTGNDHRDDPDDVVIVIDPDDIVPPDRPDADAPAWDDASHWHRAVKPLEPDVPERVIPEPVVAEPVVAEPVVAEPVVAEPEDAATPEAGAETENETPAAAEPSWADQERWREVVSGFIDDPRGSVQAAAALAETELAAYIAALRQREDALRLAWRAEADPSTEDLRIALRDYREFGRQLPSPS
jgi:hypothetical protein